MSTATTNSTTLGSGAGNESGTNLSSERRMELAAFLRSRRGRINPEDLGLMTLGRRRTPGLRREEVAQLSGIGVTWYTWLEQGRPINVSEQVLEAVARTLQLDDGERSHLFTLADMPLLQPLTSACIDTTHIQRIIDKLQPFPAVLQNDRFDILAWNQAHSLLGCGRWDEVDPSERNLLRWVFINKQAPGTLVNWDSEVPNVVAIFRSNYAQHVGEPAWETLLSGLLEDSPKFSELWQRHDVAQPTTRTKLYSHPDLGLLRFATNSFRPNTPQGTRITVYLPDDDATAEAIQIWNLPTTD